jgi:hypothetical protein
MWALVRPVHIAPGEPLRFEADQRIVDWMFGMVSSDPRAGAGAARDRVGADPRRMAVRETMRASRRALDAGGKVRLVVEGTPGSAARRFRAEVARLLERQPLLVDPAPLAPDGWAENFMRLASALPSSRRPAWSGAPAARRGPTKIALAPVQIVCDDSGEAAPARAMRERPHGAAARAKPRFEGAAWRALAPQLPEADEAIATIPGLTLDRPRAGRALSAQFGRRSHRAVPGDRPLALQGVGRAIDPQFDWDDLGASRRGQSALRRVAFEARTRAACSQRKTRHGSSRARRGFRRCSRGPPVSARRWPRKSSRASSGQPADRRPRGW